jgi:hypothetical protein
MNYEQWREELFGHPPDSNPVLRAHSPEFHAVPPDQAFDFVDRMLLDREVHSLFSKDQLGNGIHTVYSNGCSDLPFLYTTACDETRRLQGIRNLVNLYQNYFERYCTGPVHSVGNDNVDGPMGFICYMFWDIFILYPGDATSAVVSAAIDVMRCALQSRNDHCLASAIHGLGHWALDVPDAVTVLERWLERPTTDNLAILDYARSATTGMIL